MIEITKKLPWTIVYYIICHHLTQKLDKGGCRSSYQQNERIVSKTIGIYHWWCYSSKVQPCLVHYWNAMMVWKIWHWKVGFRFCFLTNNCRIQEALWTVSCSVVILMTKEFPNDSNIECHFCNWKGHFEQDCFKYSQWLK